MTMLLLYVSLKKYKSVIYILTLNTAEHFRFFFFFACGASKRCKPWFSKPFCTKPDCAVIVEYYMLPGGISTLLWATCADWRRPSDSSCCLETGGGHALPHQMLLPSFSPRLLHSPTSTSLLSVCQHFPRGGVRHGVRGLGCQLTR